MTSWKQYPHLFANGKFSVLASDVEMNIFGIKRWVSRGIDCMIFILEKEELKINEGIDSCQLIARPISDMTDEERCKVIGCSIEQLKDFRKNYPAQEELEMLEKSICAKSNFVYALSIGVYPFDDDTDVIFKPNI